MTNVIDLYEITIDELQEAYANQAVSCVEVVSSYLTRIAAFDRAGAALNSVVVLNPDMFLEAAESDRRWRSGQQRPLEGIPFTVKDSYMVQGLTVAAGSPAFQDLIAQFDAFSVEQLRAAGAVLIGKTNMPPMADGGMQRGVYGRAESPYNPNYLAAAYASGSSNGSGVATAANFAVFGMGEETVSSGRSPASNNALCAYTPSWGMISIRGNWPLFPARDVVVPHTRTMGDMLHLVDVLVADDDTTRGDFWRAQQIIDIPAASELRPDSFVDAAAEYTFEGKVFGVPRMYLGKDDSFPIRVRPSVLELWRDAVATLESLGATVVEVDFPLIEEYERGNPGGEMIAELGVIPDGWMETEFNEMMFFAWDDFLKANGDPRLNQLADVDPDTVFPRWPGTLPDRYEEVEDYDQRFVNAVAMAKAGLKDPHELPDFERGLNSLVQLRNDLFESWLEEHQLDGVVFPAAADVGAADADFDLDSNDRAWDNGVFFSNGNYALRHFGIPSVTVPMGTMADIGMPVGLTFAGKAYSDADLLGAATVFDDAALARTTPSFAPRLFSDVVGASEPDGKEPHIVIGEVSTLEAPEGAVSFRISGELDDADEVTVTVNGQPVAVEESDGHWVAETVVATLLESENPLPDSVLIVACATNGFCADADYVEVPMYADDDDEGDADA